MRKTLQFINQSSIPIKDKGVLYGLLISFGLIGLAIILGGNFLGYFSVSGFLIVVGGTLGAALVNFSLPDIKRAFSYFWRSITTKDPSPALQVAYFVGLARKVRAEGSLVLDKESKKVGDNFLKLALELAADGENEEEIKTILKNEMLIAEEKNSKVVNVFETLGFYSPSLGLIGTIIGLVNMMRNLSDPLTIGPAMSVALLTTLYGAVLANLIFLPIAGKLQNKIKSENLIKKIIIEGVASIAKDENPVILQQRLQAYLLTVGE